jgi:hypothetical protein
MSIFSHFSFLFLVFLGCLRLDLHLRCAFRGHPLHLRELLPENFSEIAPRITTEFNSITPNDFRSVPPSSSSSSLHQIALLCVLAPAAVVRHATLTCLSQNSALDSTEESPHCAARRVARARVRACCRPDSPSQLPTLTLLDSELHLRSPSPPSACRWLSWAFVCFRHCIPRRTIPSFPIVFMPSYLPCLARPLRAPLLTLRRRPPLFCRFCKFIVQHLA